MAAVRRTSWRALCHADFSMTVPAMRGTATNAMIRATPTRNWDRLEDRNALEVYRKDASRGWTARLSARTNTATSETPRANVKYG